MNIQLFLIGLLYFFSRCKRISSSRIHRTKVACFTHTHHNDIEKNFNCHSHRVLFSKYSTLILSFVLLMFLFSIKKSMTFAYNISIKVNIINVEIEGSCNSERNISKYSDYGTANVKNLLEMSYMTFSFS